MRRFTMQVFDEVISGTGTNWYTSANYNDALGSADALILHAVTTDTAGTGSPAVTCQLEHSADGRKWDEVDGGSPEIDAEPLQNDASYTGFSALSLAKLGFVRVRISLTGTSPVCRLKLFATGRALVTAASNNGRALRQ